jgi:arylsulfatase A-like enzyme
MTGMRERRDSDKLLGAVAVGVAVGLALFALESFLALRQGAVGLNLEIEGPYAALFAAIRPRLPLLFLKVVAAYLVAGAALGAASGMLASIVAPRGGWKYWAAVWIELIVLVGMLAWARAIARPALFDDLPLLRPILEVLTRGGQPWHPYAAVIVFLALHLFLALRRWAWRAASWAALLAATAVAWVGAGQLRSAKPSGNPLVLIVGIDAFRPDRLSAYGGDGRVAPSLEEFARDATLFDRAYTPIAQTEPAWRSLLTARSPDRTGVRYPLTAEWRWTPLPTFAERFSQSGYHTTFLTDCSRFNYQGESSGFKDRRQPPRGAINFALEKLRYRGLGVFADNTLGALWLPEFVDNRALAGIHNPIAYAERLSELLVVQARQGPLLFAYHATAAHFPGDPVYPHYRQFVDPNEPLERRVRMSFAPIVPGSTGYGHGTTAEALYDELLAQADAQLGILLRALKAQGLYDDALIVVFSDHGESFHSDMPHLIGATPVHGSRLGEEENRILLAIKPPTSWRAGERASRVGALTRLIDVGPTLLDLAGLPPLPEADGTTLAPLLRGKRMEPLQLVAETGFTHVSPDVFDSEHVAAAPRTFDAYLVRQDGVIEVTEAAHRAVLREKDMGTFDGRRWLIRSPRKDGSIAERCMGQCSLSASSEDGSDLQ